MINLKIQVALLYIVIYKHKIFPMVYLNTTISLVYNLSKKQKQKETNKNKTKIVKNNQTKHKKYVKKQKMYLRLRPLRLSAT